VILASVIGGALVVGLLAAAAATWTWVSGLLAADVALIPIEIPVWALIAALAALGFIVYEVMDHWSGIASFFSGVWDTIKTIFKGALDVVMAPIHAIEAAWDSLIGGFENPAAKLANSVKGFDRFFIELGQVVKKGWDAVIRFFTESPAKMADDVAYGLGRLTHIVVDFFTSLPQKLTKLDNLLYNNGRDMIHGLETGIENGAKDVWAWMLALPGNIVKYAVKLDNLLYQKGLDLLHGAERGIEDGAKAVWDFLTALPGHVIDFFKAAPGWLYDAGKNILAGLWNGFTGAIQGVYDGVKGFISGIINSFMAGFRMSSPSMVMHDIGSNVIAGLWNGLVERWNGLVGMVAAWPGQLLNIFSSGISGFGSVGYNICVGIYNGIVSGWSMLTGMVSNLASSLISSAKSALGIGSPSRVFADEIGAWIAPGLAQGLASTAHVATSAATKLARDVTQAAQGGGALGGSGLSLSGGASGAGVFAPQVSGGGSGMNLQVVVQGHVWTTQDLVTEIQQQLLRHGIRNNTPGINYTYA
jgi:phage-related protein